MKLVFLDIDGVLNSNDFRATRVPTPDLTFCEEDEFDRAAVALLNQIIARSGAKVVISSSWRVFHELPEIVGFLESRGFIGEVIGKTPRLHIHRQRGDEIKAYLDALPKPPESYVVLDDDSDMDAVRDNFVQTDSSEGLTWRHVDRALAILERPPSHQQDTRSVLSKLADDVQELKHSYQQSKLSCERDNLGDSFELHKTFHKGRALAAQEIEDLIRQLLVTEPDVTP